MSTNPPVTSNEQWEGLLGYNSIFDKILDVGESNFASIHILIQRSIRFPVLLFQTLFKK